MVVVSRFKPDPQFDGDLGRQVQGAMQDLEQRIEEGCPHLRRSAPA
jgi:hypothetical protein